MEAGGEVRGRGPPVANVAKLLSSSPTMKPESGNAKGGSITVPLTSCGQCHKTFHGNNYVAIGVTQSKYAASGVITAVKSF